MWDLDAEAAPALIDVVQNGKKIPAVVAVSKASLMFFLDRETGKSIYPVEERPVPQSDVPGEQSFAHAAVSREAAAAGALEHEAGRNFHGRAGARKILPRFG